MKKFFLLLIVSVSFQLFSGELTCPQGCGSQEDPDVAMVGRTLFDCLKKINFLKEGVDGGSDAGDCFEEYESDFNEEECDFLYSASYSLFVDDEDGEFEGEEYFIQREGSEGINTALVSYSQTNAFVHHVLKDLNFYYDFLQRERLDNIEKYRLKIAKIPSLEERSYFLPYLEAEMKALDKINDKHSTCVSEVGLANVDINKIYYDIFNNCIRSHGWFGSFYYRGLLNFQNGYFVDAFDDMETYLKASSKKEVSRHLSSEACYYKGLLESEMGSYLSAIDSLSKAIEYDPENKEAYFERAVSYYELGEFDLSLNDYLSSGIKPRAIKIDAIDMISFSLGLTQGILKGGAQAGIEFIPSLLSSLHGIGHGLWVFAQDPIQVSSELVHSVQACLLFIKNNTPQDTLSKLVPELRDLFEHWEQFKSEEKGRITGEIIGKYGVDIFAGVGIAKGMRVYRELKRANNLLTLEAMAISERNRAVIALEAKRMLQVRNEVLRHANLKIQWDKQGKHIVGHRNYISKNKSILQHSDPQRLANDFCGKGIKIGIEQPGTAGYQELIDFKEFIGYSIERVTGEKTATSWGKIHYAENGVHIVPTKPR